MELDAEAVRAVLAPLFLEVDEAILDYLAIAITEDEAGAVRPLRDDIAPLLIAWGVAEEEHTADVLCSDLEQRLADTLGAAQQRDTDNQNSNVSFLNAPMSFGTAMETDNSSNANLMSQQPFKSRLFNQQSDDDGAIRSQSTFKTRKEHDGVPLSKRKEGFAEAHFGLRPHGGARAPRQIHSVGVERPLHSDARLKIQPRKVMGKASDESFYLNLQTLT